MTLVRRVTVDERHWMNVGEGPFEFMVSRGAGPLVDLGRERWTQGAVFRPLLADFRAAYADWTIEAV